MISHRDTKVAPKLGRKGRLWTRGTGRSLIFVSSRFFNNTRTERFASSAPLDASRRISLGSLKRFRRARNCPHSENLFSLVTRFIRSSLFSLGLLQSVRLPPELHCFPPRNTSAAAAANVEMDGGGLMSVVLLLKTKDSGSRLRSLTFFSTG